MNTFAEGLTLTSGIP